jgi:hypothetical protein
MTSNIFSNSRKAAQVQQQTTRLRFLLRGARRGDQVLSKKDAALDVGKIFELANNLSSEGHVDTGREAFSRLARKAILTFQIHTSRAKMALPTEGEKRFPGQL